MIYETILSTANTDGTTHFSPIGVILPDSLSDPCRLSRLKFRLYPGSNTYRNLLACGEGVVNLTDNVLYFADASLRVNPPAVKSHEVKPNRLAEATSIWEFSVTSFEKSHEPALVTGKVLFHEEYANGSGFCRARGAVIEAAVALSRYWLLSKSFIKSQLLIWQDIVARTVGEREKKALSLIVEELTKILANKAKERLE